ncbi:Peptidoglycan-associated lipoprotein [Dyadobacter sp. CECT 9623]|uniref:Peptidoglycan-associated lipoprotein n=1 Tax=Dyadobacter linearis TaxID=2823330 RepID=A0ABM8UY22_9BACT|nr:OmpA family protein [Dyadobacter sp. CECT 9623]CAG5074572.1 Peptidoglycan-associated lipoprotein [Dyadobacter sp. CECT 9623]
MKKIFLIGLLCSYCISSPAQLLDRIKNRVEQKVVDQIDDSIDKATQKKKNKDKTSTADTSASGTAQPGAAQPGAAQSTTVPSETQQAGTVAAPAVNEQAGGAAGKNATDITAYSRFDFVPGNKIILHEDFSQDELGDFPANWNTRSGAEIVNIAGKSGKWLRINQNGVFYPEYLTGDLPENFTLQLDLIGNKNVSNIGEFMISLMQTSTVDEKFAWGTADQVSTPSFKISFQPTSSENGQLRYSSNLIGNQYKYGVAEFNTHENAAKVSIWKQKQRVRVYLDSTKVLDLPRALDPAATLNSLIFAAENPDFNQKGGAFFIGNIQLAVGAADTRNKLVSEGKFVTRGILFNVNSDKILPQSYGTLKDIAQVLQENTSLRVQIVGHTDADGNENTNEDLSKRRAGAVKETLVSTFSIDASRLETDGKGKSQPIDTNDTPIGKANNRRVEFIRL